jgi:hypothetical protein
MAITTVDGIVAGLVPPVTIQKATSTGTAAGEWQGLQALAGNPGAWTLGSPGLNGANLTQSTLGGALPYTNPSSGNGYLAQLSIALGANMTAFMLYDVLWYNTGIGITTTTAQSITTPTFNSRCVPASGSTPDALGGGLEAWLYCSANCGNGSVSNTTFAYTNQAGTGSRSAGLVTNFPASAKAGQITPFALQAGDTGIRSIQSITLGTSYVSGTVNLLVVRRLAQVFFPAASVGGVYDFADLGLPRIYDSSALYGAVLLSGTAAGAVAGSLKYAQG